MLVPRSFKYSSSPPNDRLNARGEKRSSHKSPSTSPAPRMAPLPVNTVPYKPTPTEPVAIPSSKAPHVSQPQQSQQTHEAQSMSTPGSEAVGSRRRKSSTHNPHALSPSVAALLAVTAIPPRRPSRFRKRSAADRRISIEELVSEWKSDESLKSGYGTSPVLDALLENTDDGEEQRSRTSSTTEAGFLNARSASSESVPSLQSDTHSLRSTGSPSTPESLRSRRSISNLKKPRATKIVEDCVSDHPLAALSESDSDEDFQLPTHKRKPEPATGRYSFKSNLTASLQNLKNAAISSITSLSRANSSAVSTGSRYPAGPLLDEVLWAHPFLFPRFSSEIRPVTDGSAAAPEAQRRYLNPPPPLPLTFEEQEAPFQQALHAPYLAARLSEDADFYAPTIQMQTYSRAGSGGGHHHHRRGSSSNASRRARAGPDPSSEAGRALLGADGVRQREIRENPDFLRVVVLEMNMRREGKLESGRARIWLPPRREEAAAAAAVGGSCAAAPPASVRVVPSRWVGQSAY